MDSNFWMALGSVVLTGGLIYYTRMLFKSSRDQGEALRDQTEAMNGLTDAIISLQSRLESVEKEEKQLKERLEVEHGKLQKRIRKE